MKIGCRCGAMIIDQTDYLPHKAHLIPDQEWFDVLELIDTAIERTGSSPEDKVEACRMVRTALSRAARMAWQCSECGRLYVDDQEHQLREFIPASDDILRELLRSRPSPKD